MAQDGTTVADPDGTTITVGQADPDGTTTTVGQADQDGTTTGRAAQKDTGNSP